MSTETKCIVCGLTQSEARAKYGGVMTLHSDVRCNVCGSIFAVPCGIDTEERAHKCPVKEGEA